jgi:hypothetical protein
MFRKKEDLDSPVEERRFSAASSGDWDVGLQPQWRR